MRHSLFFQLLASALLLGSLVTVAACEGGSSGADSGDGGSDAGSPITPGTDGGAPGDGGNTDGDGGLTGLEDASAQERQICEAYASRAACEGGALVCSDSARCIYGRVMLPEAASVFAECRGAPSCKKEDECVDAAGKAAGGATADAYTTTCLSRRAECANAFKDDFCAPAVFAYAGLGAAAQSCLEEACGEIEDCITSTPAYMAFAACK